jgi:hypothetical protein
MSKQSGSHRLLQSTSKATQVTVRVCQSSAMITPSTWRAWQTMEQPKRLIQIDLRVRPDQTELLEGLDFWLQLGLLSHRQVRHLGQHSLTCPLPDRAAVPTSDSYEADFIAEPVLMSVPEVSPEPRPPARPSWVGQMLSSLMAEISVVWLLFLGVFMVVVSSAVLAATQWKNFSIVGQYSILWGYTTAFGLAGLWAGARSNLRLTGRMLQIATLLLVPVNFWMIDGFGLWQNGLGWVMGALAALSLSALTFRLLRSSPRTTLLNVWGLSWLHWGWAVPGIPLIAAYVGTIGTAVLQVRSREREEESSAQFPLDLGSIAIAFSTLLLIGRAVLVKEIPLSRLGLALGICGWILCWTNRRNSKPLWTPIGAGLLVVGWAVTVMTDQWQALAVSGLVLWLLTDRLRRFWRVQEVVALILVGLQTYALLRVIFPPAVRRSVMATIAEWAHLQQGAWELTGLGFFLYVLIILGFAAYLRRSQHSSLAIAAEQMALGLGILLVIPGALNPLVRAIYFLIAGLTLRIRLPGRLSTAIWYIYLTHLTGLLAVFAWIDWSFPTLAARSWAIVLLISMVTEWGLCATVQSRGWQLSAWYFGIGFAACSYVLLISANVVNAEGNLIWLVTPILLTLLSRRPQFLHSRWASWLSVIALLIAPLLTIAQLNPLLITLAIAIIVMLVNTQQLQKLNAAAITVGFGVSFAITLLWRIWDSAPLFWVLSWVAIVTCGLWLTRHLCSRRETVLASLYTRALNGWAVALSVTNLCLLTLIIVNQELTPSSSIEWQYALAIGLTTSAIVYRIGQRPTNLGLWGAAWGIELLAVSIVELSKGSWDDIAIVTLSLGLLSQLLGDVWLRRHPDSVLTSLHGIPPLYVIIGGFLAHYHFTSTTGLVTLAAALPLVGVGRRQPDLKPLTYLGILTVSIAAYEGLTYQLLHSSGGDAGDGVTLLAGLATAIAIIYRLVARWLQSYLRLTRSQLLTVTHIHWLGGSILAFVALIAPLSPTGHLMWIGATTLLAGYAIWQGRTREEWVYFGVIEGSAAIAHVLSQTLPESTLLNWGAAIASLSAFGLYTLPWQTWGWSRRPWQTSAALLPGAIVLITNQAITVQSLLLTAAFYAWFARTTAQIRLSYLALGLADWAILKVSNEYSLTDPLWFMTVISGSILYGVQIDPALRSSSSREVRHLLRCLAVGLFCFTALYQSDRNWVQGLLTIVFSLGLIGAGLTLRIRAFLYVGTATFMLKVVRQLWFFINNESLLLWAMGIVLGLVFIWIAATFEARRSQAIALVQYWLTELDRWE